MRPELILSMQGMNLRKGQEAVQRRSSGLIEWPSKAADSEWLKTLFGYSISGAQFTVLVGEIHFRDQIYSSAETDLTIAADLTYVYVEMEWGTGTMSIKQRTVKADATANDTHFRKWLYLLNFTAPASISIKTYGHVGGAISIMPVFG